MPVSPAPARPGLAPTPHPTASARVEPVEPPPPLLGDYLRAALRRWRLVVAVALAGLLLSGAGLLVLGSQETARTDLNLNVISTDPFNAQRSAAGLLDGPTEVQIARSYAVADAASKRLGGVPPEELRDGLTAELVAQATVMRISYTASDETTARERADAIAAAYLDYRGDQAVERRRAVVDQVDARLDELRDSLTDVDARAAAAEPGSSAANQAQSDRQLITIEVDSLLSQRNSLQLIDASGGSVLSSASSNPIASAPNRPLVLASGLLAGLVIGLTAAVVANLLDRRVRSADDVERFTGAPVLTQLPGRIGSLPAGPGDAELLRTVRERLLARLGGTTGAIAIVDDGPAELAGEVAIHLAVAIGQSGAPVRLLLPGIDETTLERLRSALGLRLLSRGDEISVWSPQELGELRLIVVEHRGGLADPDALLTRAVVADIARHRDAELVLLALPSAAPQASRLAAARLTGAVLGVAALGSTSRAVLARDAEGFESLGTELLGSVLISGRRRLEPASADEPPAPEEPRIVRRTEPPRAKSPSRPASRRRGAAADSAAASDVAADGPASTTADPAAELPDSATRASRGGAVGRSAPDVDDDSETPDSSTSTGSNRVRDAVLPA
ncbi:hypothetical protein FJ656_13905 [Schumannella luteola]|uniref:Capsular polysaccharide biosynthesis protein n=1 Tax=Schumannella luteola TaxID=472059 RepID=A0A852YB40_9MICO|nr:hypothetical protein [Schumannella luteola]NYH00157.1 capsular polysaccharide biosynthesis protein [Schumannella luteola]TPX04084.1 hypothetical protein FJ656_13905 [Schumannella luteola]